MLKRVLIADDDPDILAVVSTSLRHAGYEVVSVTCGAALLERLAEDPTFDLVISDVAMPWLTGVEVTRSLRAAGIDVPVILMSGFRTAAFDKDVRSLGGRTSLLRKPFAPEELDAAIDCMFSNVAETNEELAPSSHPSS